MTKLLMLIGTVERRFRGAIWTFALLHAARPGADFTSLLVLCLRDDLQTHHALSAEADARRVWFGFIADSSSPAKVVESRKRWGALWASPGNEEEPDGTRHRR